MKLASALLLTLLVSRGVHAEEDAHETYKRAAVLFDLGKFAEAAAQYEKTYLAKPVPELLYNIAQAYRLAGDIEKALFFYRRYLGKLETAKNRPEVERRIQELEAVRAAQHSPPNDAPAVTGTSSPTTSPPSKKNDPPPTEKGGTTGTTDGSNTSSTGTSTSTSSAITGTTPEKAPAERRGGSKVGIIAGVAVAGGVLVLAGLGVGLGVALAPGPSFNSNLGEIGPGPHMGSLVGF